MSNRAPRKPNAQQKRFNSKPIFGVSGKQNIRRAQQIASQRMFTYEPEGPICLGCGGPRETRSGLHCNRCLEERAA